MIPTYLLPLTNTFVTIIISIELDIIYEEIMDELKSLLILPTKEKHVYE